ncbi:PREDICTED: uncharacterized protein LOC105361131 [Ceratosolen solmsi marchali]|uniref:Uncharacterized protein LOC105361131 n=1 Tax=Ceratosolen solmsi marchali TaxID=326594 RepID=A0AAJ6YEF7_9HYME|nr:PREDICTED: uncharacterized protein LOC105361131 [Ceratosolen solmsi marchali]
MEEKTTKRVKKNPEKWHRFQIISPTQSILRGNCSIIDKRFKLLSRGKQASAAAVVGIVYAHLLEPRDWTSNFLDRVLEDGDRLFRISQARNRLKDDIFMTTSLLEKQFFVGDYKCNICTEIGIICGNVISESIGFPDLKNGLNTFLRTPNFGILTSQEMSVAIWNRQYCGYFYIDPAPVNECGKRNVSGFACIIRVHDIESIVKMFVDNLKQKIDSKYSIDKISVTKIEAIDRGKYECQRVSNIMAKNKVSLKPINEITRSNCSKIDTIMDSSLKDTKNVQELIRKIPLTIEMTNNAIEAKFGQIPMVDQNLLNHKYTYDEVKANVPSTFVTVAADPEKKILHGWTNDTNAIYKGKGSQSVANCVMAIVMKKLHPVKTWLRKTLDDILAMGDAIFIQVKNAKPSIQTMTAIDLDDTRFKFENNKMIIDVDLLTIVGTVISKVSTVLNLKQGLEEFFIQHTDGVLECSSMAVTIWMQENYYYIFDSQPCDISGIHVIINEKAISSSTLQLQNENTEIMKKNIIGKCCVVRFTSLNSLYEHLLKNLDSAQFKCRFTIRRVIVVNDIPGIRDWYYFKPAIMGKSWILRGNINSDDDTFDEHSRGIQDLAISVVTLITAQIILPSKWSRQDVDNTVREGNDYYNWCNPPAGEVLKQFHFFQFNNKYFAIWKFDEEFADKSKEEGYYLFCDKPWENFLNETHTETNNTEEFACVLKFPNVSEIIFILKEQLEIEDEIVQSFFFIHEIKVASMSEQLTDEEIEIDKVTLIKPELRAYTAVGENGAFLCGSFNQANDILFKMETRDKQQAANALVTLAMTKLYDPHLWSTGVIDDILKMSDKLSNESSKNLQDNSEEDMDNSRQYLLPSEINPSFFLGINEITVNVEENSVIGQLNDLTKNLEDFFVNNKMGIFRKDQIILSTWKEESIYFAMDPRGQKTGNATVYWYIDISSLAEILLQCCEKSDGDFILDSVTIENHYSISEHIPEDYITEDKWYNFSKIEEESWKIDCHVTLTDEIFSKENQGNQSAAICIMAIVFSKAYEPRYWSTEILDEITITGDTLHSRSVACIGENKSFQCNEIISEFFIANRRIDLNIQDCVQSGTVSGKNPRIKDIITGISNFFERSSSGCIMFECLNVAIWTYENYFYYFKPGHFLMRFENKVTLAKKIRMDIDEDADFIINSIDILDWNKLPPWTFDPSSAVRPSNLPPLNAYCRLQGRARAILRGFTHQASEIFSENIRGHQTAANCVISLAMFVIKNPVTWTRKTLDEILAIGVNLHRESLRCTSKTTTLKPCDIIRIFHIGVNVLAADVEKATITGIVTTPPPKLEDESKKDKNVSKAKSVKDKKISKINRVSPPLSPPILLKEGLKQFFETNNAGILIAGRYMVAIWIDNGVYFMYDPRSRNHEGLKEDENEGTSCVVWFACMQPLFDLLSTNINDDEKYVEFEISRVIIKTICVEPLPSPISYKAIKKEQENLSIQMDEICPSSVHKQQQQQHLLNIDLESSFKRIDQESSVLLGSNHMSDRLFSVDNRGLQSTAIAAVAIVVATLLAPSTWTSDLINATLKYGDILHTECARLTRPGSRTLSISELLDTFVVGDVRARIRLYKNTMAGITLEHDLASALELFFTTNLFGIMHTSNYAIALMKHWGKFYFFDASERNGFKGSFEGSACLIRCENITKLTKVMLQVCSFKEPTAYTLNAVQILDLHFFT